MEGEVWNMEWRLGSWLKKDMVGQRKRDGSNKSAAGYEWEGSKDAWLRVSTLN
jgi:hypothetical protein